GWSDAGARRPSAARADGVRRHHPQRQGAGWDGESLVPGRRGHPRGPHRGRRRPGGGAGGARDRRGGDVRGARVHRRAHPRGRGAGHGGAQPRPAAPGAGDHHRAGEPRRRRRHRHGPPARAVPGPRHRGERGADGAARLRALARDGDGRPRAHPGRDGADAGPGAHRDGGGRVRDLHRAVVRAGELREDGGADRPVQGGGRLRGGVHQPHPRRGGLQRGAGGGGGRGDPHRARGEAARGGDAPQGAGAARVGVLRRARHPHRPRARRGGGGVRGPVPVHRLRHLAERRPGAPLGPGRRRHGAAAAHRRPGRGAPAARGAAGKPGPARRGGAPPVPPPPPRPQHRGEDAAVGRGPGAHGARGRRAGPAARGQSRHRVLQHAGRGRGAADAPAVDDDLVRRRPGAHGRRGAAPPLVWHLSAQDPRVRGGAGDDGPGRRHPQHDLASRNRVPHPRARDAEGRGHRRRGGVRPGPRQRPRHLQRPPPAGRGDGARAGERQAGHRRRPLRPRAARAGALAPRAPL
ncbi:MAG: N-acyl-D-amino-acid deacylase, partial [uncultured Gemmatimonadetes bacterium]